jgi:DNA helicase II / ATP-dependent DNA helicase PcrA
MIHIEKELNPPQLKAVQTVEGPLLILAGAGSGKTRVITYRIAHLIENRQVRPDAILAVTFTNKAAEEMMQRVHSLLRSGRSGNPTLATFHSFCVRVLRRDISAIGYGRDFTIYDDADQLAVVKNCLKEMGLDETLLTARYALSRISYAKNHGLTPEAVYQQAYDAKTEKIAVAFGLYEKKLKQANALDFDDLLLKTVEICEAHPSLRQRLNEQFRYVMVDEYQDTNRTQYQLIRHLTQLQQNLCVVGDEDQSIYGWRGADIQNILSFEKDYPQAQIIKLEQNYRSTKIILDAAGAVVAHNEARKGKSLWTQKTGGDAVTLYEAPDAENEALFVAQQILSHHRLHPNESLAVLYRTNFQSRLFEEACRRNAIKYSIVGGFSFYERAEIKDLLCYLKVCLNPQDSISLLRIVNTPPRGIGRTTIETLEQEARKRGLSLWETILLAVEQKTFTARTLHALTEFQDRIQEFLKAARQIPLSKLIRLIMDKSGYVGWLESEGTQEELSRIENLQELVNAARDSEERGESLRDFLDHAALVSDTDDYDARAKVTLMTLHSAKGLEFPVVFIVGLEEGLFPHSRSSLSPQEVEEERRLCYVGMTRAQRKLTLTRAKSRRFLGSEGTSETEPSRFIYEIPSDLIETVSNGQAKRKAAAYDGPAYNTIESIREFYKQRGKPIDLAPTRRTEPPRDEGFKRGSYVRHAKYGVGMIVRCEGEGDDSKLTVSFPGHGLKKLVPKYAALEKV